MRNKNDGSLSVNTSEPEAILQALPQVKQRLYISALYSIAKDAIRAQCKELKVMDLEILASLEEESNAHFEEWVHSDTFLGGGPGF